MYFTPERAAGVIENLANSLAHDGWFAVSPSECSHTRFPQFTTVHTQGSILYRKPGVGGERTERTAEQPGDTKYLKRLQALVDNASASVTGVTQIAQTASAPPTAAPSAPLHVPLVAATVLNHLHTPAERHARALANQGRLEEALLATLKWLENSRMDPTAHYLHAMVHQELGHPEKARKALQRVLYLQPDFVLAHFGLGNIALTQNRHTDSIRHLTHTLELLQKAPPNESVPESGGTTAAALIEIVEAVLLLQQQREPADIAQ